MTTKATTKKLFCGGRGPCCHIGYPYRHCDHCDVVVDTRTPTWYWSNWQLPTTVQPYQPHYWGTTTGGMYSAGTAQPLNTNFGLAANAAAADSSYRVKALPNPTVAHACEATG